MTGIVVFELWPRPYSVETGSAWIIISCFETYNFWVIVFNFSVFENTSSSIIWMAQRRAKKKNRIHYRYNVVESFTKIAFWNIFLSINVDKYFSIKNRGKNNHKIGFRLTRTMKTYFANFLVEKAIWSYFRENVSSVTTPFLLLFHNSLTTSVPRYFKNFIFFTLSTFCLLNVLHRIFA